MCEQPASSGMSDWSKIITAQLLEKAIAQQTNTETVNVKSFTVSPGSEKGENFASITSSVKVIVQSGNEERTYHLFIKLPHSEGFIKDWMENRVNLFTKESRTYSELITAMVHLQTEKGLEQIGPSVPMHYYSVIEKGGGLVVLEDLCSQGYIVQDKMKGIDVVHCKLVMKELATFHALAFALKKENPQNMMKSGTILQECIFTSPLPNIIETNIQTSLSLVEYMTKDQKIIAAAKKLQGMDPRNVIREQTKVNEPYALICHGDAWCNNLLFRYEMDGDTKIPVDVKLVDFQLVRYDLLTTDLAYFFYTSTTRETRKKHLKHLLCLYHSYFIESLKRLNMEFPEFTLDLLELQFKQSALFGIEVSCALLPSLLSKPEKSVDFSLFQEENAVKHMTEFIQELFGIEENRPRLQERLIGCIEEAVEMGLL